MTRTTSTAPKNDRHGIFKKDRSYSIIVVVINHRKNTAACVSLSKSTISKTYTRETQGHCLAPVCGGGGDVVASEVLVKNFFSRSPQRRTDPEIGGGGVLATPHFRVKLFFLKNFFRRKRPRRDRRERLPKDNQTPCQPGFSATPQTPETEAPSPQKITQESPKASPFVAEGDLVEARKLCQPHDRSKKFLNFPSRPSTPKAKASEAPKASPSPSEAGV